MRATDLLLLGFLFVHLLPTGFCQKFCAPRAVVTSLVRATVYRSGRTLPDICGTAYDEFRIQLEYVAVRNMDLAKGCSVVSLPVGHECRQSGQKATVDVPVNLTCNDECIPFESSRQLELLSRMHGDRLVEEVRRRQTKEVMIQGQRVRLAYKKGRKTYFEYCPGGLASTVDSNLLCECGTRCCFGDLVFSECASLCPRTCDSIFGRPVSCPAVCVQGCSCPDNMVQDGNKCILPTECPNSQCLLPPDVGTGRAVLRDYYYYNGENQRCERLRYSGCGGNENHFPSKLQCEAQCSDPRCRGDYVLSDCATSCGLSCENYHLPPEQQPLCGGFCFEGCFCPPGLIPVKNDGDNSECAKPEECARALCPRGQIFRHCAGNCGLTCENHHLPPRLQPVCSDFCFPGCSCEDGLIPAGPDSDRCVPPDRCRTAVCTMRRQSRPCNESESTVRYFFNQARGRCERFSGCRERGINNFRSLEDCRDRCEVTQRPTPQRPPQRPPRPSPTPSTLECPGVKEYRECGTACPLTCDNINTTIVCTLQCVQGCFCPSGLVEYGEHCVPPQFCPSVIPRPSPTPGAPQCPGVKEFDGCGTACPLTCDNPGPLICTLQCVGGCFCPPGLVELDDTCVPAEFCPNRDDGSTVGTTAITFTGETVVTGDPPITGEPPYTEELPTGGRPTGPPSGGRPTGPPSGGRPTGGRPTGGIPTGPPSGGRPTGPPSGGRPTGGRPTGGIPTGPPSGGRPTGPPSGGRPTGGRPTGGRPTGPPVDPPIDGPPLPRPPPMCPPGKRFSSCGTACPSTCDNYNNDSIGCTLQCVEGCFCREGTVEHERGCVIPQLCPNHRCQQPVDSGPCRGSFPKYYYNSYTKKCENFTYGGCAGNDNRFETLEECQEECPEAECPGDKVFTRCGSACPRTCDNKDELTFCTLQCVEGCQCPPGTVALGDRCVAEEECPSFSHCLEPITTGPCRASIPAFGYNVTTGRCERFIYGGCEGNNNNFCTRDECENVCDPCRYANCDRDEDCLVDQFTEEIYCSPSCTRGNPCRPDERCVLEPVQCLIPPCPVIRSCLGECSRVRCAGPPSDCQRVVPADPDRGICCPFCSTCPDGQRPFNCLVDPCRFATCVGFPDARCVPDYCGGCNARFFQDGQEVECGVDCSAVLCLRPICGFGEELVVPPRQCCPVCQSNCMALTCPADVICGDGESPEPTLGGCCFSCIRRE
jgi:hypothetical protein